MDNTTEAVTRLTDALANAAPNSRVTVLSADLRNVLIELAATDDAYRTALDRINELETQHDNDAEALYLTDQEHDYPLRGL